MALFSSIYQVNRVYSLGMSAETTTTQTTHPLEGAPTSENGDSLLSPDDVLELFRDQYKGMKRSEACRELDIPHPLLCDYLSGRRKVHRCKKVMGVMGLEGVEFFTRKGKDSK